MGGLEVWGFSKISIYMWKLFYLLTVVRMKRDLPGEYLFWPPFSHITIVLRVLNFPILQNVRFFAKANYTRNQNQSLIPEFLVYFKSKSLSFAKINPHLICKPLHLRKLVQGKILQRTCSEEVKKLVHNKMSSSCWENVKNILFLNPEFRSSCKKGEAGITLSNDVT